MVDRDIDFVVVTGAGASCPFGVNGTRLPMMGEWSEALVRKLSGKSGYLSATRLDTGIGPEEFEARLGTFLHKVAAFEEIESLLVPSLNLQQQPTSVTAIDVLPQWHRNTIFHLQAIVELIRESLYELFAEQNLDIDAAASAYGELFARLGIRDGSRWLYATTNYDVIGESVIRKLGWRPDWGQLPQLQATSEAGLDVDHLVDALPRSVPVLHLHGRVGWYRRQDGSIYASAVTKHNEGYGIPIVMLPDLEKSYGEDGIISALWRQFEESIARAKRVLVLGHSLHDAALIRAIQTNLGSADRLAVTVLAHDSAAMQPSAGAASVVRAVETEFSGSHVIPLRFGEPLGAAEATIARWLSIELSD